MYFLNLHWRMCRVKALRSLLSILVSQQRSNPLGGYVGAWESQKWRERAVMWRRLNLHSWYTGECSDAAASCRSLSASFTVVHCDWFLNKIRCFFPFLVRPVMWPAVRVAFLANIINTAFDRSNSRMYSLSSQPAIARIQPSLSTLLRVANQLARPTDSGRT